MSVVALIARAWLDGSARNPQTATSPTRIGVPPILLFSGEGTSANDVAAVKEVLDKIDINYSTASSSQLNAMNEAQLGEYRLLIVPGGNFIQIGNALTPGTMANLRSAIGHGLNYLGICAGGFLVGRMPGYNSLDLTGGVQFQFCAAGRGIERTVVSITIADGHALNQYWEDGPQFSGWGSTVGKYPDGTPAIVEGSYGDGAVILVGTHPEAPLQWQRGLSIKPTVRIDDNYASTLVRAALRQVALPHY